ncbi:MAG TPA: arsenate reductase family protein [Balneolales bacterium]|nr:arsenate reductase family protein [Balneolales bacterium]
MHNNYMLKVCGIKNCDTMNKTFKWLENHGIEYDFIDLKKTPFSEEELAVIAELVGLDTLVNRRGMMWRKLGLAHKDLSDQELFNELLEHQTMIKRPVMIDDDNAILVGFDEEAVSNFVIHEENN